MAQPREQDRKFPQEAQAYLDNSKMFDSLGKFARADLRYQVRPWLLFRFFDEVKVDLNEKIPWLTAAVLLATMHFLKLRFIDLNWAGGPRLRHIRRRNLRDDSWQTIWVDSLPRGFSALRAKTLHWTLPALVILFLAMEFGMNTPNQRIEWFLNLPSMLALAVATPVLIHVLWDLGKRAVLDPQLGRYSNTFELKCLKNLITGLYALLPAAAVVISHSVLVLTRTAPGTGRWQIQSFLAFVIAAFALQALSHVEGQRKSPPRVKKPRVPKPVEDELNASRGPLVNLETFSSIVVSTLITSQLTAAFYK